MRIEVHGLGKTYNRNRIFHNFDYKFENNNNYALTGPNGSGKSTLLQNLAGLLLPTSGTINYYFNDVIIPNEQIFKNLIIASPYTELIEEMTLLEFLKFHFKFKQLAKGINQLEICHIMGLADSINKQIKHFSSGMKQRLKLGIAFYSEVSIIFLDEPASNLDKAGFSWYLSEIDKVSDDKIIIIASNLEPEYKFCDSLLHLPDFK